MSIEKVSPEIYPIEYAGNWYDLKLGKNICIASNMNYEQFLTRVPGGWIIETWSFGAENKNINSVFIPFSSEFLGVK